MFSTFKIKGKINYGRVSLFLVALLVIITGLVMNQWWWKVGGIVLLIQFVQAYSAYRTLD